MTCALTGSQTVLASELLASGDALTSLVVFVGARAGAGAESLLRHLGPELRGRAGTLLRAWRDLPSNQRQALVIHLFGAAPVEALVRGRPPGPTPLAGRVLRRAGRERRQPSAPVDG